MYKIINLFLKIKLHIILPFLYVSFFLGAFYYFTAPMLLLDIKNASEASLIWLDEGLHLRNIERMQSLSTWELLHPAYTAFYSHLSYAISWFLSILDETISTSTFISGSRWASYLCVQILLLIVFWRVSKLLRSLRWAFLGMCFLGMQRGSFFYSITMHPEAPMLLGIVVAIFAATEYLCRPRFFKMSLIFLALGLAISSKIQALLLLPWAGIIGLLGFWTGQIKDVRKIVLWISGSFMTLIASLLLFTPYQIFHWQRLWQGIQSERLVQTYAEVSLIEWFKYTLSNELVGYSYSVLLLFTLIHFIKKVYLNRKNLREWLGNPVPALFVTNLILVVFGLGYVYLSVEVLIARYLTHVVPSIMFLTFIGVYWLSFIPKNKLQFAWLVFLATLVVAGMQQQTKHASFDFRVRKQIAERLVHIRQAIIEIKNILPRESYILDPPGQYIDSQWFVNANYWYPTKQNVNNSKIEYWLLSKDYPGSLKREGVSLKDSSKSKEYQEKIKFWEALTQHGLDRQFLVKREFKKARLILYSRVLTD